jgi:hypothetical protein
MRHTVLELFSHNSGGPLFEDQDGAVINVAVDVERYLASGGRDILLLHHQNVSGKREEVVELEFEWPFNRFFPILGNE